MQHYQSITLIFWEKIGNTYTFQLRWSNWNLDQLIWEWGAGRGILPVPIPEELINAVVATKNVPHRINAGTTVQNLSKEPYIVPIDLKLDYLDLNTCTTPDMLSDKSVQDLREQYFISALAYYIPIAEVYTPTPPPTPPQYVAPGNANPTLPGIIHVCYPSDWNEYECSITERNFHFGYTIARSRYLWFFDMSDPIRPHIVLDYTDILDYSDPYLQAASIMANYPHTGDYKSFDIRHFNDSYKDEYYSVEMRPPLPNRWYPPRDTTPGGDPGNGDPTDTPYWRDPSPLDILEIPLVSIGRAESPAESGWEPFLFNGNQITFNGFSIGCIASE